MKHKTWFRLVLKAIGVLLIGFGLPGVATLLASVGYYTMYGDPYASVSGGIGMSGWYFWSLFSAHLGDVVQLGLGLYLLFGGRWIADLAIPSNRPYCPQCGYDISQSTGDRCPECGVPIISPEATETNAEAGDPR